MIQLIVDRQTVIDTYIDTDKYIDNPISTL